MGKRGCQIILTQSKGELSLTMTTHEPLKNVDAFPGVEIFPRTQNIIFIKSWGTEIFSCGQRRFQILFTQSKDELSLTMTTPQTPSGYIPAILQLDFFWQKDRRPTNLTTVPLDMWVGSQDLFGLSLSDHWNLMCIMTTVSCTLTQF